MGIGSPRAEDTVTGHHIPTQSCNKFSIQVSMIPLIQSWLE